MVTFTFIADLRGGTYIFQANAPDVIQACIMWKDAVVAGRYIVHLDVEEFSEAFDFYINELPPVVIDDVIHVWNFGFAIGKKTIDVHIVQTDTVAVEVGVK